MLVSIPRREKEEDAIKYAASRSRRRSDLRSSNPAVALDAHIFNTSRRRANVLLTFSKSNRIGPYRANLLISFVLLISVLLNGDVCLRPMERDGALMSLEIIGVGRGGVSLKWLIRCGVRAHKRCRNDVWRE